MSGGMNELRVLGRVSCGGGSSAEGSVVKLRAEGQPDPGGCDPSPTVGSHGRCRSRAGSSGLRIALEKDPPSELRGEKIGVGGLGGRSRAAGRVGGG